MNLTGSVTAPIVVAEGLAAPFAGTPPAVEPFFINNTNATIAIIIAKRSKPARTPITIHTHFGIRLSTADFCSISERGDESVGQLRNFDSFNSGRSKNIFYIVTSIDESLSTNLVM